MRSIVDGKLTEYQKPKRFGQELGFFLLNKLAQYEGDFIEDNQQIDSFIFVERGNTDEISRIRDFQDNHADKHIWHNFITHPKTQRTFNLLISYR